MLEHNIDILLIKMILTKDDKEILIEVFYLANLILEGENEIAQQHFYQEFQMNVESGVLKKIEKLLERNFDYIKFVMTKRNYY